MSTSKKDTDFVIGEWAIQELYKHPEFSPSGIQKPEAFEDWRQEKLKQIQEVDFLATSSDDREPNHDSDNKPHKFHHLQIAQDRLSKAQGTLDTYDNFVKALTELFNTRVGFSEVLKALIEFQKGVKEIYDKYFAFSKELRKSDLRLFQVASDAYDRCLQALFNHLHELDIKWAIKYATTGRLFNPFKDEHKIELLGSFAERVKALVDNLQLVCGEFARRVDEYTEEVKGQQSIIEVAFEVQQTKIEESQSTEGNQLRKQEDQHPPGWDPYLTHSDTTAKKQPRFPRKRDAP